jgi:hypothetical protein
MSIALRPDISIVVQQVFPPKKCCRASLRLWLSPRHKPLHRSSAFAIGSRDAPRTHGDDVPTRSAVDFLSQLLRGTVPLALPP